MNYKNIINIGLTLVVGLLFFACSQSEDIATSPQTAKVQNGFYMYPVNFNCGAPEFDAGTTRAVTYNWQNKATLFARFKSGSTYYQGFITNENGSWVLLSTSDFFSSTQSGTCELYYFLESNGDYYYFNVDTQCFDIYNNGSFVRKTNITSNTGISLSEGTAIYSTATANYSSSSNTFTIDAILKPKTWRLRFNGTNGTKITLPKNGNDIKYYTSFDPTNASLTNESKEVNLTVSSSYTPYIYGEFSYSYITNDITVVNNSYSSYKFKRELLASAFPAGQSGYFTIPTPTNYSSYGWTTDATSFSVSPTSLTFDASGGSNTISIVSSESWTASSNQSWCTLSKTSGSNNGTITVTVSANNTSSNRTATIKVTGSVSGTKTVSVTQGYSNIDANATIMPNYLVTFTDGMVTDWTLGSTVNKFYYGVYTKTGASSLTDDELATQLFGGTAYSMEYANYVFRRTSSSDFSPNTQYYLCAVAKNSSGKRGPVLRHLFKTNSSSLPYAEISNIQAATSTKWTYNVTLKNSATSYYLATTTDESDYNDDWHFWAFYVHYWATIGDLDTHTWTSVQSTVSSGTCNVITICTWGVGSNGSIGNPRVAHGNVSSSAPVWKQNTGKSSLQKEAIPKRNLEKMLKNTKLYRVNN